MGERLLPPPAVFDKDVDIWIVWRIFFLAKWCAGGHEAETKSAAADDDELPPLLPEGGKSAMLLAWAGDGGGRERSGIC